MDESATPSDSTSTSTPTPSATPIADAIARLGESGEGLAIDVAAGSEQKKPTLTAEGWWEWGRRNQFGAGAAVQLAKDAWAAVAKFRWRPGREK